MEPVTGGKDTGVPGFLGGGRRKGTCRSGVGERPGKMYATSKVREMRRKIHARRRGGGRGPGGAPSTNSVHGIDKQLPDTHVCFDTWVSYKKDKSEVNQAPLRATGGGMRASRGPPRGQGGSA